jgi:hypothetical protein
MQAHDTGKFVVMSSLSRTGLRHQRTRLPPTYLLVLAEIISSTLKMEAMSSSETSVVTQQPTRRHIPENDSLHNHRCENLKSYTIPVHINIILSSFTQSLLHLILLSEERAATP